MTKDGPLCSICPLFNAPGPVYGEGNPNAKIAFIGMAPADDEVREGHPFVGGAGRILNRGCFRSSIRRDTEAFTTNLIKCYVPPKSHIPPDAAKCCRPILEKELNCLESLRVTVTLGKEPFYYLTGRNLATQHNIKAAKKDPLYWLRGAPFRSSTLSKTCVLPTIHPAGIAYAGFLPAPYFEADLSKAARYAREGIQTWKEVYNYDPTDKEIQECIQECLDRQSFGLDIETVYTSEEPDEEEYTADAFAEITVIGISPNVGSCTGVPPSRMSLLQPLFSSECTLYAFNWGFDGYHLSPHFDIKCKPFDVMFALHELYSDISPKDLATALSIFTDLPYHKNLMLSQPDLYNARDTYGALAAGLECERLLDIYKMRKLFENFDMPMVKILSDIQHVGARCDVELAEKLELACYMKLEAYESFWKQTLPTVLWSSNDQLIELFQRQGLPIHKKKRTRVKDKTVYYSPCVDEDVLEEYRDKHKSQLAGLVLEMRTLKKASQFCHPFSSDGRMHTRYKNHGTGTGRLAAREPNAQNIPEKISDIYPRAIIVPDNDDSLFVGIDFSQMQLWIYAYAANDLAFLEAKRNGDYIHGVVYEQIFPNEPFFQPGMPKQKQYKVKGIEPWKLLLAKTGPLGLCFGRETDSLTLMGINKKQAQDMYDSFHWKHPAIKSFHRKLDYEVEQKGFLQNFFGRMRRFPNPKGQRNEYLNFPGQSNESDILRRNALIPLSRELPKYESRIILTVHDSIGLSVPKRHLRPCVSFVRDSMEAPIKEMKNFYIPCEITVGKDWHNTISWEDYLLQEQANGSK